MGAKREPYATEFGWAVTICAPLGCTVERSAAMYEVAKVKGDGVALVIYPHRTTAGHYHLRVRDNNSKDKAKAARVLQALDDGEGLPEKDRKRVQYFCTFSSHMRTVARLTDPGAALTAAKE